MHLVPRAENKLKLKGRTTIMAMLQSIWSYAAPYLSHDEP
jgi:hypothetical protein